MDVKTGNENINLGALLVETGTAITSLILFPALAQRMKISPVVVNAVKIALRNRDGGR